MGVLAVTGSHYAPSRFLCRRRSNNRNQNPALFQPFHLTRLGGNPVPPIVLLLPIAPTITTANTKRPDLKTLSTMWTWCSTRRYPEPLVEGARRTAFRTRTVSGHPSSAQLSEIAKLVDAGKLKPVVETVLPLSDARRAHELNETGHARGKTVLIVA
jgi:hypothetical protein